MANQKGLTERDILLNKIKCEEEKRKAAENRLREFERIYKEQIKTLEKRKINVLLF